MQIMVESRSMEGCNLSRHQMHVSPLFDRQLPVTFANKKYCSRTLSRSVMYWEIHPQGPTDFTRVGISMWMKVDENICENTCISVSMGPSVSSTLLYPVSLIFGCRDTDFQI